MYGILWIIIVNFVLETSQRRKGGVPRSTVPCLPKWRILSCWRSVSHLLRHDHRQKHCQFKNVRFPCSYTEVQWDHQEIECGIPFSKFTRNSFFICRFNVHRVSRYVMRSCSNWRPQFRYKDIECIQHNNFDFTKVRQYTEVRLHARSKDYESNSNCFRLKVLWFLKKHNKSVNENRGTRKNDLSEETGDSHWK
jgi:hypothetical protein